MLTSNGVSNKSLQNALRDLVSGEIKIAFIPTAANPADGEKSWLINDLVNCRKVGEVDIVDISALEKDIWLPRLKKANVIFVGGGDTVYLNKWITKSGLVDELPKLLRDKVYVGISAGSIVLSKDLAASSNYLYSEDISKADKALGFVDFYVRPHLNSPDFPKVRDKYLKQDSQKLDQVVYALDDDSGIVFIDGAIKVISEGEWKKYSPK